MKEATGTAGIENQESLYLKILNHLGLSEVKVLSSLKGKARLFRANFNQKLLIQNGLSVKTFAYFLIPGMGLPWKIHGGSLFLPGGMIFHFYPLTQHFNP